VLQQLFADYIREKRYLQNVSEATVRYYSKSFKYFVQYTLVTKAEDITKPLLNQFLVTLREKGKTPENINCIIKGVNPFLSWLARNEYISLYKLKELQTSRKVQEAYTDEELKRIISFKPRLFEECRLHALLLTMIDTGARISELLKLRKDQVDLEHMLVVLVGKGKERIVPISFELRKVLYKYLERKEIKYSRLVFPSRRGGEMYYQDIHFQMSNLLYSLHIPGKGFHAFRRKFARNYLKNGGNLMYLMKAMGHSKITTTQLYLEVETEELAEMHFRTSLLSRLK